MKQQRKKSLHILNKISTTIKFKKIKNLKSKFNAKDRIE